MGFKKFYESKWFIVGGAIVLALLVFAYVRAWYQEYQINQEIAALTIQAEELTAKRLKTLDQLQYVGSSDYIESKARTELNLAKEGEHMVVLDKTIAKNLAENQPDMVEFADQHSSFGDWFRYFVH